MKSILPNEKCPYCEQQGKHDCFDIFQREKITYFVKMDLEYEHEHAISKENGWQCWNCEFDNIDTSICYECGEEWDFFKCTPNTLIINFNNAD